MERLYSGGITHEQADKLKKEGRGNTLPPFLTKPTKLILKEQALSLFNAINLIIAAALIFVGSYANLLFMGVVISNLIIGITEEIKAKKTIERLSIIHKEKINTVREDKIIKLDKEDLVEGDTIILKSGEQVPADCVIIKGEAEADEQLLSGEQDWVKKSEGEKILSGSVLTAGECAARIINAGERSYANRLIIEAKKSKRIISRLMQSLNYIIRYGAYAIGPLGVMLLSYNLLMLELTLKVSVEKTAASVIGMIPSGLVLLIAVSLSIGVIKLAKAQMLVKEPLSIESLARASILCLDKTGTLTTGDMLVEDFIVLSGDRERALSQIADYSNAISEDNITSSALKRKYGKGKGKKANALTHFSSVRGYGAASFDEYTVYVGAPGKLCADVLTHEQREDIQRLSEQGYRVLLMACADGSKDKPPGPNEVKLLPAAIIPLSDAIRENAAKTIKYFKDERVNIKLISGDDPHTLKNIAKRLDIKGWESCVDASTIKDDEKLAEAALKKNVFGRVSPQQKRSIIGVLQGEGNTVAMAGDGVNDLLALRKADCSIALYSGTDAVKQSAHMVLLTNDFSALAGVVREGRRVVNNMTRMASLFLVKSVYSFFITLSALIIGFPYPFIPLQLTLIGGLTIGVPSFLLSLRADDNRISGGFYKNILSRALPGALCVFFSTVLIAMICPHLGLSSVEINTLCVYMAGSAGICVLIKNLYPLDRAGAAIIIILGAAFYISVVLFHAPLGIIIPNSAKLLLFVITGAALSYPMICAFSLALRVIENKSKRAKERVN